jgi:hypothetical protein
VGSFVQQALHPNQPNCARNVRVKLPSDDGHELNSQLLPQQECLDLQMPEKLEQIFEYRQTWPLSLTVKQGIHLQQSCWNNNPSSAIQCLN